MERTGESLNFLGFTLRYDRDRYGRNRRYLNLFPASKPVERFKDKVRALTGSGYGRPLKDALEQVSRLSGGWKQYFDFGYPRKCFRDLNWFVLQRFKNFLQHRSQRKCKPQRQA